jgi:hypothetical protein
MYKIVLVTPGQPALNPRLVKEADALANAGYDVSVIFAYWNFWGNEFTKKLLSEKKWKAICVGGDPVDKPFIYFVSRVIYNTARFIVKKIGPVNYFAELAASRSSFFLIRAAKKQKADLYIAHYPGALAPCIKAAAKNAAKCGFDAEDFHRQEIDDNTSSFNFKIAKHLEDKYLSKVDYITASSPQIAAAYHQLYINKTPVTILNVSHSNNQITVRAINTTDPVKLFWFSQTIGHNRGIDTVVNALQSIKTNFELHLLGHITNEDKKEFLQNISLADDSNIYFHEPIPPDELTAFAAQFDIGLALEPGFCKNNNLALSNKIFTYLQAGLTIVASDTIAQKHFLEHHPEVGEIYRRDNIPSLTNILTNYQLNRESLFNACKASLKLGTEKLNWENESKRFLLLIEETLKG